MGITTPAPKRYDSKTIAMYAIFLSLTLALEIFPYPGITDIPIPGLHFTIDWTGIPLILIFLFFGPVLSMVGIGIMGIAIGYRNPFGAVFKVFAEFYKILGVTIIWFFIRNRNFSLRKKAALYAIVASTFCAIGMFATNIQLLQLFYFYTPEAAYVTSLILIPWNILQSVVNVLGGVFLFNIIPRDLRSTFIEDEECSNHELIVEEEE